MAIADIIAAIVLAITAIGFWACVVSLRGDDSLGLGLTRYRAIAFGVVFMLIAVLAVAHLVTSDLRVRY
jgi:hypothetical protein